MAPAPNARHDTLLESKQKNRRAVNPMEPATTIICASFAGMLPAGTMRRLRWMSKGSRCPDHVNIFLQYLLRPQCQLPEAMEMANPSGNFREGLIKQVQLLEVDERR